MKLLSFTCCKQIKLPNDNRGSFLNSAPQAANPEFGNKSCDSGETLLKGLPSRPGVDAWRSGRQLVLGLHVHISMHRGLFYRTRLVLTAGTAACPASTDKRRGTGICFVQHFGRKVGRSAPVLSLVFYSHLGHRAVRRLGSFLMLTRFQVDRAGTVSGRPDSGPSPGLNQGLRNTWGAI